MRRVLIISYFFPPCNLPASNRANGWARYLADYGYYPVIITRNWERQITVPSDIHISSGKEILHEKFETHEVFYLPYKAGIKDKIYRNLGNTSLGFISKIFTFFELILQNFVNVSYSDIYRFCKTYLEKNSDVKLLVITANPFTLFRFGYLLKKKYNIPWLADYHDDWNTSELFENTGFIYRQLSKIEKFSEKKWVGSASFFTSISGYYCQKISDFVNIKGFTIHNGFVEEEFLEYLDLPLFDKFTITFNGTLYQSQPVEIFVEAFIRFINKRNFDVNVMLNFHGLAYNKVQERRVMRLLRGYEKYFSISPRTPKKDILEIQARSQLMLMIAHDKIKGVPSSKLYEYIALHKSVLLCPTDNDIIEQTLADVNLGILAANCEEAFVILNKEYDKYLNDPLLIPHFNKSKIDKYSRKVNTRQLALILNEIVETQNSKEIVYRQCVRCVMDTSDTEINFDSNGFCNHCREYFGNISNGSYSVMLSDNKLKRIITKIKNSGKNKIYDCIVGVSGGEDSSYTAVLLKKLGMRPLAVHMDNGWDSENAVSNINKMLKKLDIELYTYVLDWEEFRNLQLAFLKASVPEIETPTDIAISAVLHQVAAKYNIKYIFSGGNYVTEGILPKSWHYNAKDEKYLIAINSKFNDKKLRKFPLFGFQKELYYKFIKRIRMIYLLNYIQYNKSEVIDMLTREFGWRNYGGKHHESVYTKFVQSYILPVKFGFDYRKATFSSQICAGDLNREEALSLLEQMPHDDATLEEDKKYFCKKLGISLEDFDEIMKLPLRTFEDYPNDRKKLELIYKIYRRFNS